MLKKIILPLSLLIFTQQEFYGMKEQGNTEKTEEKNKERWKSINDWLNYCSYGKSPYPKLWLLWTILDNIHFQHGFLKVWEHAEAYYGLSNGFGFFPSFLNFKWIKIGIGDVHFNIINLVLDCFKYYSYFIVDRNETNIFFCCLSAGVFELRCGIHIISVKILRGIKIKLIAPLALVSKFVANRESETDYAWYIKFDSCYKMSWWYAFWSPRIEINISELINYFKK